MRKAMERAKAQQPTNIAEREQQKATGKSGSGEVFVEKTVYQPSTVGAAKAKAEIQSKVYNGSRSMDANQQLEVDNMLIWMQQDTETYDSIKASVLKEMGITDTSNLSYAELKAIEKVVFQKQADMYFEALKVDPKSVEPTFGGFMQYMFPGRLSISG